MVKSVSIAVTTLNNLERPIYVIRNIFKFVGVSNFAIFVISEMRIIGPGIKKTNPTKCACAICFWKIEGKSTQK